MCRKVVIIAVMLVLIMVLLACSSSNSTSAKATITLSLSEAVGAETVATTPLLPAEPENYCVEFGCDTTQWCSADGCLCTEMDCFSQFHVQLEGTVPSAYLVEATESSGQKVILHCFEPDVENNYPYSNEDYALDESGLERVREFSSAITLCEANSKGRAQVTLRSNGVPEKVVVHCFELPEDESHDFLLHSSCATDVVTLAYPTLFLPDDLTVTIHTDSYSKTVIFEPEFEPFWPNGPACSPTCYNATVTLNLP